MAETADQELTSVPKKILEAAMEDVAIYRQEYNQITQSDSEVSNEFVREFHGAVLHYYTELRKVVVVEDEDWLREEWQKRGLPKLGDWVTGKYETVETQNPGMGTGSTRKRVPAHLPADDLRRYSVHLDIIAAKLGLKPDVDATEGSEWEV